jgi:DNA-directed RNA polymerase specialized sigma24 family protein
LRRRRRHPQCPARQRLPQQDLPDGTQDVYVKALESFQRAPPPTEVPRMMALCAEIARNHAIDWTRGAAQRKRDLRSPCDALSLDGGKTWVAAPSTLQAKTNVYGFAPGATVLFRFRPVTKAGEGDWSQPVSLIVK